MSLKRIFRSPGSWVFVVAMAIRVYAGVNSHIVNPDGVLYIQQAKAIFYGQWDLVTQCTVPYLSFYSIFVAAGYGLLGDWVVAGRSVSLCFGVGMFLPLYLILRQFFTRRISGLTLLIYAFIPVLVSRSPGIVRGPVFWFFLLWGIYLYISHLRVQVVDRRVAVCLVLSNVAFLLAAWARIEGLLFIPVSCAHLLLARGEDKIKRLALFVSPVLVIGAAAMMIAAIYQAPIGQYLRVDDITAKLTRPFENYRETMIAVEAMAKSLGKENRISDYLMFASNLTWLIALGTLFSYALEAYFYPYFVFFLLGLLGAWRASQKDVAASYLLWSTIAAVLLIYFHLIEWWFMYNRFLAIIIMPSCIFIGFGLSAQLAWLKKRNYWQEGLSVVLLVGYISVFGIVKNSYPIEPDKAVFQRIGEQVAEMEGHGEIIKIVGLRTTVYHWITFYANLAYPGHFCLPVTITTDGDQEGHIDDYIKQGFKYLLVEENAWKRNGITMGNSLPDQKLKSIGRWRHADTGNITLYRLTGSSLPTQ